MMTSRKSLTQIWPLFGLELTTPRLTLRLSEGSDLAKLTQAARTIQGQGQPQYQDSWMYEPSPTMERQLLQRYWKRLANWEANAWHLKFLVYSGNNPIGLQDIWSEKFPITRSVTTGSWLTLHEQGKGYGTEMRTAVLELAFGKLGALEAITDFYLGNKPSAGVSSKLGYKDNGQVVAERGGRRLTKQVMRLTLEDWQKLDKTCSVNIQGFEPCLEMFGLDQKEA